MSSNKGGTTGGTSNFADLADILARTSKDGVECRVHTNASCVNCGVIHKTMVRVGAFIMCNPCWEHNFNVDLIPMEGPLREKYLVFLKRYQNEVDKEE